MTSRESWMVVCCFALIVTASCGEDDCKTCETPEASGCEDAGAQTGQSDAAGAHQPDAAGEHEPDAADAQGPAAQDAGEEYLPFALTLTAKRVATAPTIDGDGSDEQWGGAAKMTAGTTQWKAVYTADELAVLVSWPDRNLVVDTNGAWSWDPTTEAWFTTISALPGNAKLHKESFYMAWDIANSTIRTEGCAAFCHGDGTVQHHNTTQPGAYVDVWLLLNKHGFGAASGGPRFGTGPEDSGWLAGVDGASQTGDLLFDAEDLQNPRSIVAGEFTFKGYGEDKVMSSPDDDTFASQDTPAAQYCARCHDNKPGVGEMLADYRMEDARTFGDTGEIPYFRNGTLVDDRPLYMEVDPTDFVDALILTQTEVDAGEAVAIDGLTSAEISEYWAGYEAVNAVLPELVLKTPTGSQADVQVGVTWKSGTFTLELKRRLITGNPDDVQFSDFTRPYYFAVTMVGGPSPLLKSGGTALRFEQ